MPMEIKKGLAEIGHVHSYDAGEILFSAQQKPHALYLIVEGVVEIFRTDPKSGDRKPIAYVGPGETVGESKIITGTAFASSARFPDGGRAVQWPRHMILRNLHGSSDFSLRYLHNLARRLEGTLAGHGSSKLDGKLDHFDLPTILQTVVESGSRGELIVRDERGSRFGTVYVGDRLLGPIQCGRLSGAEALFEMLLELPRMGDFTFTNTEQIPNTAERYELNALVLEAARISDELRRIESRVPPTALLRAAARQLAWTETRSLDIMEQIWEIVSAGDCTWNALSEKIPYSRGNIELIVWKMVQTGVLTVIA
jgi:hypothetical protein